MRRKQRIFYFSSTWVLLSPDARIFGHRLLRGYGAFQAREGIRGWTDDYTNLLQIVNDRLRRYHLPERVPAVSGAAPDRENHFALVRRIGCGMGRGAAVFSARPARRLCVFARIDSLRKTQGADVRSCRAALSKLSFAAYPALAFLETVRSRRSDDAHPVAAGRYRRPAVFSAFLHQSAASSLVRAPQRHGHAVPAFRALEFRIDAGTD